MSSSQCWFVYIVQCADDTLYTGVTTALERRVAQHNAGTGARYTRQRRPVSLLYYERAANRSLAQTREAAIKRLSASHKRALATRDQTTFS